MTTTTRKKKFKCPECPRVFAAPTGLGSHMRTHGVAGNSPASLAARRAKAKRQSEPEPKPIPPPAMDESLICPECREQGITLTFDNKLRLGHHRHQEHHVIGASKLKMLARLQRQQEGTNGHAIAKIEPPRFPDRNPGEAQAFDPIALALAVGSVKEFCRNFSEEHEYVTKHFTRSVAQLLLRQASR
jgi:hypothetical protein